MQNDQHRVSGLNRSLWMGLAMFFVVFSCPVKKYIRMQLYKHYTPTEHVSLTRLGIPEGKDCSIADKHNQALAIQLIPDHFFAGGDGLLLFLLPTLIFTAFGFPPGRKEQVCAAHGQGPGGGFSTIPLYLRHRHFLV